MTFLSDERAVLATSRPNCSSSNGTIGTSGGFLDVVSRVGEMGLNVGIEGANRVPRLKLVRVEDVTGNLTDLANDIAVLTKGTMNNDDIRLNLLGQY